jgi:hypothetical protein
VASLTPAADGHPVVPPVTGLSTAAECAYAWAQNSVSLAVQRSDDQALCALITSRGGDSGASDYTEPVQGRTLAVGVLSSRHKGLLGADFTCYWPIQEIPHALGGLDRLPQPGEIR